MTLQGRETNARKVLDDPQFMWRSCQNRIANKEGNVVSDAPFLNGIQHCKEKNKYAIVTKEVV